MDKLTEAAAVVPTWQPANEAERRMADALARGDVVGYFRIVATAPLFLPTPVDEPTTSEQSQVLTITIEGRRHVLVFASVQAAAAEMGDEAQSLVATTYRELVENWPDPEWCLAVDPGSPIGVLVDVATVMQTALAESPSPAGDEDIPDDLMTRAIDVAVEADNPALLLDSLVLATVFLPTTRPASASEIADPTFPWRSVPFDGVPTIMVFTSEERMVAGVGAGSYARLPFVDVLVAWPDPTYRLAIDFGWPTAMTFDGDQLPALASWFDDVMNRHAGDAH